MEGFFSILVFAGLVLLFIFRDRIFDANTRFTYQLKSKKNLVDKIGMLLQKDLSPDFARAVFYIDNDYDNGMSQAEWKKYCEDIIRQHPDKNSKEYAEAVAPIANAIVNNDGVYGRRGMEYLNGRYIRFEPGLNDRISLNYFVEPYEYRKNEKWAEKSMQRAQSRQQEYERTAPQREAYAAKMEAEREAARKEAYARNEKAIKERREEAKARSEARLRCKSCMHYNNCSAKFQTGSCGGFRPRSGK